GVTGRTGRPMSLHEQMHMSGHELQRHNPPAILVGLRADKSLATASDPVSENPTAIIRAPRDVIPEATHATSGNVRFPRHAGEYTHRLCQPLRFRRLKAAVPSRGV